MPGRLSSNKPRRDSKGHRMSAATAETRRSLAPGLQYRNSLAPSGIRPDVVRASTPAVSEAIDLRWQNRAADEACGPTETTPARIVDANGERSEAGPLFFAGPD